MLLSTLHEEYEFVSPSSVAIAEMVALFLGGLKERSVFAMALQDRKATGAYWEREGVAAHGWRRVAFSYPQGTKQGVETQASIL